MTNTNLSRRSWIKAIACMAASPAGLAAADSNQVPGVHERIRNLAANAPLKMQFHGGSAEDCRSWQREFSAKLRSLLGPHQPPPQWTTTRESAVDFDDHRLHQACAWGSVSAFRAVPAERQGSIRPASNARKPMRYRE